MDGVHKDSIPAPEITEDLPNPPILSYPPEKLASIFEIVRKSRLMTAQNFQQLDPSSQQYIQSILSEVRVLVQLSPGRIETYPPRQRDTIRKFISILKQ
jgi:hypothetical protein